MMSNWEVVFVQNALRTKALSLGEICSLRVICNKWNSAIESVDALYEKIVEAGIFMRLHYPKRQDGKPSLYKKDYYDKQIIISKSKTIWPEYNGPLVVYLNYVEDDLLGEDIVVSAEGTQLPLEFQLFIKYYQEYPDTRIRLYQPKILQKLVLQQIQYTHKRSDTSRVVHLTPICYSKHYRGDMDDKQFISVLCYVNALDNSVFNDLGSRYERFHVIILELDDLQDKKEHYDALVDAIFNITNKIESNVGYLEDLDLMTFCQCYDRLLKKQKYNL